MDQKTLITVAVGAALGFFACGQFSGSVGKSEQNETAAVEFLKKKGIGRQSIERYARDNIAVDKRIAKLVQSGEIKNDRQLHAYGSLALQKARERSFGPMGKEENKLFDSLGKNWDSSKVSDYFLDRSKTY